MFIYDEKMLVIMVIMDFGFYFWGVVERNVVMIVCDWLIVCMWKNDWILFMFWGLCLVLYFSEYE